MRLLSRLARSSPRQVDVGLLVVRLWFGVVLAMGHGYGKVTDLSKMTASVARHGLPMPAVLGAVASFSELVGGLMIAVGLLTRLAALPVIGTMLVAAFQVHAADPFARKELALCYAVAALAVLVAGPGRYSLDALLFGPKGR